MKKAMFLALCSLCTGCCVFRGKSAYTEPLVYGERVNIVKPGDTVVVPELKQPAKTWYLIDDVGISMMMGIPMKNIPGTMTPYEKAITDLDTIEKEAQ